jgi:O-antigen ligase
MRANYTYYLTGVLLLLVPLFLAGRAPLGLTVLQILCVCILTLLLWDGPERLVTPRMHRIALLLLLLLPLLQLLPVPGQIAEALPGREAHTAARLLAARGGDTGLVAVSLYFRDSLAAWLLLLLPVTTYLAVREFSSRQIQRLLVLVLAGAAFQSVMGLMQFGGGPDSPFYLGMEHAHFGSAVGTYTSRNNYVGYLYLSLMIVLALYMATLGRHRHRNRHQNLRQRLNYLASTQGHKALLLGAFILLLLLAIVFSRSRAGIGLTILGVVLSTAVFARRIGGDNVYGLTGSIIAIATGIAVGIGLTPVLDRFSAMDPLSSGRWTIYEGTLRAIGEFLPLGSGAGTFRATFYTFQSLSQAEFTINRAHNDYLEWVYIGGLPAACLIVLFLAIYIMRWPRLWQPGHWGEFRYLQIGAGLGMFLMLLHEFVDYNLMTPANMAIFAFFAGIFFHDYREPRRGPRPGTEDANVSAENPRIRAPLVPVTDLPSRNPFHD